jgi:hypothetical protein
MFTKESLPFDSQLPPEQVANLLMAEAIEHLVKTTQLSTRTCKELLYRQFDSRPSSAAPPVLIEQNELAFIQQLF